MVVRIRAAGLNNADLMQVQGKYPAPSGSPADIPGLEFAGEVVALGPRAHRYAVGDRVMGIVGGGAQAELICVHECALMPIPENLSWAQAGGFPEAFVTAHDALVAQTALRPGERVLITGAAGGVGMAAVQIATAIGAEVIASVRNTATWDAIRSLGASTVVTPDDADTKGPYDVILELVGVDRFASHLTSIRTGSRIVVIGTGSGAQAMLDFRALSRNRASIRASTLRARPLEDKAIATRAVEREILPLVSRSKLTVVVSSTFPLEEVRASYAAFGARGKLGKIVLLP